MDETKKPVNNPAGAESGLNAGLGLLACPFCGSKAKFEVIPYVRKYAGDGDCRINHDYDGEYIQCENTNCGARSMLIFPTMSDAKTFLVEKWNKRMHTVSYNSTTQP